MTREKIAYRVLTETDAAALAAGVFWGSAADRADGFIHLSTAAQLAQTVNVHYAGQEKLALAAIDLQALGDAVRWEPSRDGQLFPHLYGPLSTRVVVALGPLERTDGAVRCPAVGL